MADTNHPLDMIYTLSQADNAQLGGPHGPQGHTFPDQANLQRCVEHAEREDLITLFVPERSDLYYGTRDKVWALTRAGQRLAELRDASAAPQ